MLYALCILLRPRKKESRSTISKVPINEIIFHRVIRKLRKSLPTCSIIILVVCVHCMKLSDRLHLSQESCKALFSLRDRPLPFSRCGAIVQSVCQWITNRICKWFFLSVSCGFKQMACQSGVVCIKRSRYNRFPDYLCVTNYGRC